MDKKRGESRAKESANKHISKFKQLENMNLNKLPLQKYEFCHLEYLSLAKNLLTNIYFVKYCPNLWYLDIKDNPVSLLIYLCR